MYLVWFNVDYIRDKTMEINWWILYITNNKSASSSSQLSVATSTSEIGTPGTADLPWSELGFEFRPTKSHLRMVYRDGKWGEAELVEVRWCYIMSFVVIYSWLLRGVLCIILRCCLSGGWICVLVRLATLTVAKKNT